MAEIRAVCLEVSPHTLACQWSIYDYSGKSAVQAQVSPYKAAHTRFDILVLIQEGGVHRRIEAEVLRQRRFLRVFQQRPDFMRS